MQEKKRNLAWLIFVRLVVVSIFLGSITYLNIKQYDLFPDETLKHVTRLIIATYLFSICSLVLLRIYSGFLRLLGYAQIVWEILFVSILIILTGGITSTYAFLFNLSIINASFLFGRREAFYSAGLSGIMYGLIIDLHYFGRLERLGLVNDYSSLVAPSQLILQISINLLAFSITGILTGYLAERARSSESALKSKEIDYQELQRLNSVIVSTVDSGLVTVNSSAEIGVFNRYAARLTGMGQETAYGQHIADIFPGVDTVTPLEKFDSGKQVLIYKKNGSEKVLSISSSPVRDNNGNIVGAIFDFKDITELHEMEAKLKKSDKLAAIGELSSRMAHEVRNPLAAISGSVQLIAEATGIPASDKRLLDIILRETWRLDNMLKEFLQYARPVPPEKNWFSIYALIDNLISLFKGDARFCKVSFHSNLTNGIDVYADYNQLHQVFWNLLLNAADSMPNGGIVSIGCSWDASLPVQANTASRNLTITIADSGSGIPEQHLDSIFEPFFTTKPDGTGLGLAAVYRIIEAHNGAIAVQSSFGTGTIFSISLPIPDRTDALQ